MERRSRIHPHKLALWIGLASIMMMFVALTSAYLVKKGGGEWLDFEVPQIFYFNAFVLIFSSVLLQASYVGFKRGHEKTYKYGLAGAFVLGIVFVILQYKGWQALYDLGIYLSGNPSGSFLYIISGLHALHVIGGIVALLVALIFAFRLRFVPTKRRRNRFELVIHYWHFMGFLWLYLLIFLFSI